MLFDLGAASIGVDAGKVADIVAVALQPPNERIFRVEDHFTDAGVDYHLGAHQARSKSGVDHSVL